MDMVFVSKVNWNRNGDANSTLLCASLVGHYAYAYAYTHLYIYRYTIPKSTPYLPSLPSPSLSFSRSISSTPFLTFLLFSWRRRWSGESVSRSGEVVKW